MKKVVGLLVAVALALLPSYAQYRATFGSNGVLYGLNTDDEVWVISQGKRCIIRIAVMWLWPTV